MSAASAAHGAENTSRRLTAMSTSSLVCVNTTWSPTATSPTRSSQCTSGGMFWTGTLQSVMWWSPSTSSPSASPKTCSPSTAFRECPPVVVATEVFSDWHSNHSSLSFLVPKCHITTQGSRWKKTLSTSSCSLKSALWSCGTAMMPSW